MATLALPINYSLLDNLEESKQLRERLVKEGGRLKEFEESDARLKEEIASVVERTGDLNGEVSDLKETNRRLVMNCIRVKKLLDKQDQEIEKLQEDSTKLKKTIKSLEKETKMLEDDKTRLGPNQTLVVEKLNKELKNGSNKIKELEHNIKGLDKKNAILEVQNKFFQKTNELLNETNAELCDELLH